VTVASPIAVTRPERPYPGLRPFEKDEWAIFFGRERMIDEVIARLAESRLVLIHGISGSGKSSLVRAGVLPKLALQYRRHDAPWLTCAIRPSGGPLWNLAAEFARLEGHEKDLERISAIAGEFNGHQASLASIAASLDGVEGKSVCILVDQFEELFRYEKETSRDEAELFVDLIERTGRDAIAGDEPDAVDIRVIVTMRSEFLGECARFAGFAETINRTQYLVPRMDDDGLMQAVRRPAQMYGAEFDERLAERLIESVRGREDELPLLQHGLMLMWEDAKQSASPGGRPVLSGRIVDEAGGLAELLSRHADAVMASAAPDQRGQSIVEAVFRALTDVNSEGSAIRRPLPFGKLCAVTGATPEELRPILKAFREPGVSFVTPYAPEPIEDKTVVDISHEALIRCWRRINNTKDGPRRAGMARLAVSGEYLRK
jgi:conflict system STAND superfamily ATPase